MSNLGKAVLAALRLSKLKTRLELDPSHSQKESLCGGNQPPHEPN